MCHWHWCHSPLPGWNDDVGLRAGRPPGTWTVGAPAAGCVGGRAGQYGYIPLGRHLVLVVLALESQQKGSNAPSVWSPGVDEGRMRPGLTLPGWARDVKARDRDETLDGHETSLRR